METLIQNLQNPAIYPHSVKKFQLIETHISWVLLTGEYAYKIKKPLNFEFLDFSTLEKRKFYCEEELRLNRLISPEIYLEVVALYGDTEHPHFSKNGAPFEYAIKMRQFPQEKLFTALLKDKKLDVSLIKKLAATVANFHLKTSVAAPDTTFGDPERVQAPVIQNFDQIYPLLIEENDRHLLHLLRKWSEEQYLTLHTLLKKRKHEDFIRDCHGDLHLANILLWEDKPLLFDRIEFNDEFRWTDVIADIAFLAMDLDDAKQPYLTHALLQQYFEITGDHEGIQLLRYYQAYRAVVRAKISLFRLHQPNLLPEEKNEILNKYRGLIKLAGVYTQTTQPTLSITFGVTGSGKSTAAKNWAEKNNAFHIRSDIERKRLAGLAFDTQLQSPLYQGLYDPSMTEKTYQRLYDIAANMLSAGYNMIIDAAFLKKSQRDPFRQLAESCKASFGIIACDVDQKTLEKRILTRQAEQTDPSEGRLDILHAQLKEIEPLTKKERLQINSFQKI